MSYTGRFDGVDGEKAKITDQRGSWWGYLGRGVDVSSIAVGATVEFEVEKVPPKDPTKKPYNRFVKVVAIGQGAPPSMQPVAAAVPRVAAPAAPAPSYTDNRSEDIFIAGVVNRYVQNTGDTSVAGLTQAAFNARDAFRLVQRGERPAAQPVARSADPGHDDAPF